MADRARGDRAGQVGRIAGARDHVDFGGEDAAVVVVADFVFVMEAVALAGDQHVVVAVGAQLDRALAGCAAAMADAAAPQRRLRFLAAEAAAHAPALDHDVVRVHAQRMRDHVLHLARVLGRALHQHALVFLRDRVGDLAFEVELFLAADIQLALDRVRRAFERGLAVAALQAHRRQHVRLRGAAPPAASGSPAVLRSRPWPGARRGARCRACRRPR